MVFIEFKQREFKKDKLEFNDLTILYLYAIKEKNPILWNNFFNVINNINKKDLNDLNKDEVKNEY
jgi:hypothetical protein